MRAKHLPPDLGTYRIIKPHELTEEERSILRRAGRSRVQARVCELIAAGKLSASQVQARYGALMSEIGVA